METLLNNRDDIMSRKKRELMNCFVCGVAINPKKLAKHMMKLHIDELTDQEKRTFDDELSAIITKPDTFFRTEGYESIHKQKDYVKESLKSIHRQTLYNNNLRRHTRNSPPIRRQPIQCKAINSGLPCNKTVLPSTNGTCPICGSNAYGDDKDGN